MIHKQCNYFALLVQLFCVQLVHYSVHLCVQALSHDNNDLDASKFLVFGPGIDLPNIDLPVRYFRVQLVFKDGKNSTLSPGTSYLKVSYDSPRCRFIPQLHDQFDGSYVVRFRLLDSCEWLAIRISTSVGENIAKSPYVLKKENGAPLYAEHCHCADVSLPTIENWLSEAGCPGSYTQIDSDFDSFSNISLDFDNLLSESHTKWTGPEHALSSAVCHYSTFNNEIYRRCFGKFVGFNMFSDEILSSLARKMRLPDIDVLWNLGDWPLSRHSKLPILSWCGSLTTSDIVLPTYDLTQSVTKMAGQISLDIHTVNNGITRFFFFNNEPDEKHITVDQKPFGDFFKYRFVLSIDGTVSAYRLPYLLAGDSLVLKQDSPYYEHFYADLQPYTHYVPVKRDLSDLFDQITWARQHPVEVQNIISNARELVQNYLQPLHIYCYHARVLQRYSELLKRRKTDPAIVITDMDHVNKSTGSDSYYGGNCKCQINKSDRSKLEL